MQLRVDLKNKTKNILFHHTREFPFFKVPFQGFVLSSVRNPPRSGLHVNHQRALLFYIWSHLNCWESSAGELVRLSRAPVMFYCISGIQGVQRHI